MVVKSVFLNVLKSYASNSVDFVNKAVEILHEADEISADYSDFLHSFSVQVDSSVLVLGEREEARDFVDLLQKEGYEVGVISPSNVVSISGHLGAFEAQVKVREELGKICFSQMVLFYEDSHLMRFMGCESAGEYNNPQELLEVLNSRLGEFNYRAPVHYTERFCQYHLRRVDENGEGWCHRCVDVCPSFGVSKDNSLMKLNFSALDCIACGKCVMVCPSGSVKRDGFTIEASKKLGELYFGLVPVVMNANLELENLDLIKQLSWAMLETDALTFFVPQVYALNETYLLTLMQESGRQVVIFDEQEELLLKEAVSIVNRITQAIFGVDGVFLVHSYDELIRVIRELKRTKSININWHYTYAQDDNEALYQVFSQRLLWMVRNGDFGDIESKNHGRIVIDSDKCTLCLSCVGACNTDALSSSSNFSLFHQPSLCTTCGYCIKSCPEKAISSDFGSIILNEAFFSKNEVAKSTSFECVECGKVFASSKSVEKIIAIMAPIFSNDPARLKSLKCCDVCKVKVMFGVG